MNATNLALTLNPVSALPFHLLRPVPPPALVHQTFAAIDFSADAIRLKIVRMLSTGALRTIHKETAVCPCGSGIPENDVAGQQAMRFVLTTLRRYAGLCSAHGAILRAVATPAFERTWAADDIVARGRTEAGIEIDVISRREEAHLLSLATLDGTAAHVRSLLIDIGPDGARVILTAGEQPIAFWELAFDLGAAAAAVASAGASAADRCTLVNVLRVQASGIVAAARPGSPTGGVSAVVATAGTAAAVVGFAADGGTTATSAEVGSAVDRLRSFADRHLRLGFDPGPADVVLPGAILLDAILDHLDQLDHPGPGTIRIVDRALGDGVISDLARTCGDADREVRGLA